ncbi:MAG: hypothetical protein KAI24_00575, partial [Planctomycetes bacterium]|nr:hypothetical protein [Planctomycetota bacterium]
MHRVPPGEVAEAFADGSELLASPTWPQVRAMVVQRRDLLAWWLENPERRRRTATFFSRLQLPWCDAHADGDAGRRAEIEALAAIGPGVAWHCLQAVWMPKPERVESAERLLRLAAAAAAQHPDARL